MNKITKLNKKLDQDIQEAGRKLAEAMTCNLICSNGTGEETRIHYVGCPLYRCSFERMNPRLNSHDEL